MRHPSTICAGIFRIFDHLKSVTGPLVFRKRALARHDRTSTDLPAREDFQVYKRRMGWTFPYVSSFGSEFNFDFGVSFSEDERRTGAE